MNHTEAPRQAAEPDVCWWCGRAPRWDDPARSEAWSWCLECARDIRDGLRRRRGPDDLHGARQLGAILAPQRRSLDWVGDDYAEDVLDELALVAERIETGLLAECLAVVKPLIDGGARSPQDLLARGADVELVALLLSEDWVGGRS